jgi:hypothetical protein
MLRDTHELASNARSSSQDRTYRRPLDAPTARLQHICVDWFILRLNHSTEIMREGNPGRQGRSNKGTGKSGQGAKSALDEMLRRARMQPPPPSPPQDESYPQAPRKPGRRHSP